MNPIPSFAIAIGLLLVGLSACTPRSSTASPIVPDATAVNTDAPMAARPANVRAWPALDHEPELGVMMRRARSLSLRLLVPHRLPDGHELPPGQLDIAVSGEGFRIAGHSAPGPRLDLRPTRTGGPTFAIDGATCSGSLRLARARETVEVIEVVGLETWLLGVLPAEMHPRWPAQALAAQAIAARSYACARWQTRAEAAWQLMRGTADIAYDGFVPPTSEVSEAIASTRGLVLVHAGQAILARFHACSGGRTEDSAALWPDATLADGRTPLAPWMRGVDDPASVEGARALGWTRTHQQWRAAIPLDDLDERLGKGRPGYGHVVAVTIARKQPSGRVASVQVTRRTAAGERRDEMDAQEFRLAVGANALRSLWWEKAVMASARGGLFVVEGRGFGHGVGLPQVSAWWLANAGQSGTEIIARYYPGAGLAHCWR